MHSLRKRKDRTHLGDSGFCITQILIRRRIIKDLEPYLVASTYIDCDHSDVKAKAILLAKGLMQKTDIAKACFEFVRDEIKHSLDYKLDAVTCRASDVLKHGTGYCYAKSHLLAALLRANDIPAGLCYQRLTIENDAPPFSLHGLNAVYLDDFGWYKIDARGNKPGVNAQFTPPVEKLAFPIVSEGEFDFEEIWDSPLPQVVECLTTASNHRDVFETLPDIEVINTVS